GALPRTTVLAAPSYGPATRGAPCAAANDKVQDAPPGPFAVTCTWSGELEAKLNVHSGACANTVCPWPTNSPGKLCVQSAVNAAPASTVFTLKAPLRPPTFTVAVVVTPPDAEEVCWTRTRSRLFT